MPHRLRRSFEPGHRLKFLVVADGANEASRALRFAARRASRLGGAVVLIHVIDPADFNHWLGVGEVMREEAVEAGEKLLAEQKDYARRLGEPACEGEIRFGPRAETICDFIGEDEDVAFLVLASAVESDGPGPLVSHLARHPQAFGVPVVVVPGAMSDAEIDALA